MVEPSDLDALGEADRDPVVGPDRLHLEAVLLPQARLDRHRPRRVDPPTERGEQHDPPVAELVAEALHDDGPIGGQHPGDLGLIAEVGDEVVRRQLVHRVRLAEARHRLRRLHRLQLAQEGADRPSQLDRPPHGVAMPERHLAGLAGSRGDDHPVGTDLLDPPGRGSEQEGLPHPRLVDHLLVELAHASASAAGVVAGQEDPEEAAIGDRAAAGDGHDPRVVAADDLIGQAVPDDAWLEVGELVRGVPARQHVEHALQLLARQVAERLRPGHEPMQVAHRPAVEGADGDELLRKDVERVARDAGLLDGGGLHALDDHRRLDEVAAVLGEDLADARLPHLVPRPADALHPRRDRRRRLDLDDEVDRSHIDPELEAAGRHQGRQPALLEVLLDLQPLLARDAAVVGAHELLSGELVQPRCKPLGQPAAVHEDERGPMRPDELQQPRMDRRPDRVPRLRPRGRSSGRFLELHRVAHAGHVLHGHHDLEIELLACPGVDDLHLAIGPAKERRDRGERALRRRQADALRVGIGQVAEALEGEGQVRAALRGGDRMDLVDDDVLDAAQDLAGLAGEQQVKALRRGDEDVGRRAGERASSVGGRVTGAARHADLGHDLAEPLGGAPDACQGRAQVALDVVGQRLERADVQDTDGSFRRRGLDHEPVDAPQEGGEGLAAAGRRVDEGVPAAADRVPAQILGARRLGECLAEPGPGRLAEGREGIGAGDGHACEESIGPSACDRFRPAPVRFRRGRRNSGLSTILACDRVAA